MRRSGVRIPETAPPSCLVKGTLKGLVEAERCRHRRKSSQLSSLGLLAEVARVVAQLVIDQADSVSGG